MWVADVPVPVIVNDVVPAPVVEGTVTVRIELPSAVTLVGLNVPGTTAGGVVLPTFGGINTYKAL